MKISERIKSFEAARAAKVAALEAVQEKALKEGRNKDAAEQSEFDDLSADIDAIDKELKDLRRLSKLQAVSAREHQTRVRGAGNGDDDDDDEIDVDDPARAQRRQQRGMEPHVRSTHLRKPLEKGILFARYVMCVGAAYGDTAKALMYAKANYGDTPQIANVIKAGLTGSHVAALFEKAAVAGGTTTDSQWAGPLTQYIQFAGDFVEYLRPQTILGKFGMDNGAYGKYPTLRAVPFNIHIRGQTTGGASYWVGQGLAKPLTSVDFNDTYLGWSKAASIAVLSEDLLRFSNPSAEMLVRDALAQSLAGRLDTDFVDPTKAATANVSPASVTYGSTTSHSAGTTAADCRADIATALGGFISANIAPTSAVWITQATTAVQLSLLRNAFGQKEFPDININGGMLEGVPVITSQYVPAESGGSMMILLNGQDIWLADDGAVTIDASREASLEMSTNPANQSAPTGSPPAPVAAQLVSMFQTNSVALRAERFINWQKRRASAVQVIDDVNYTGG